ncbi:MAG: autotransporter outer membrane beta-barrel domain-containing protein [Spirochaetaceae bacterium]|nr:autotransporter outer membrane beta-barrel domain-containing protein [Myxococcales bacterium]MCB9723789.1 autotransporter outer membrane beta-barrel domain-containing protein [Spirochaetaceae bacterium]
MNRIHTPARLALVAGLLSFAASSEALAQNLNGSRIATLTAVNVTTGAAAPGCGGYAAGAAGDLLTTALNAVQNTPGFDDEAQTVGNRRALYRYCDALTNTGANGWTGESIALTPEQALAQATAVAPDELFAGMDDANSSFRSQTANVARRLSLIRLSRHDAERSEAILASSRIDAGTRSNGFFDSGFDGRSEDDRLSRLALGLQQGVNAGETGSVDGIGYFVNGRINVVRGDENPNERGSLGTGGGFTLGADKLLQDDVFAGIAFGYTRIGTNYDGSASRSTLDAVTLSGYGAWYPDAAIYVDGSISASWLGLEMSNEIFVGDGGPQIPDLDGETDGGNFGFDVGAGYVFRIAQVEGLTIEPSARLNVLYTYIDGFDLTGGDGTMNLSIGSQETVSVTGTFGFRTEYPISNRFGVLTPYFRAAYVHEFNKENDDLQVGLAAIPTSAATIKLKAQATDSHYANFGLGLAATLGQGLSQFVDYDVVAAHENVTIHQITAGLRLEF